MPDVVQLADKSRPFGRAPASPRARAGLGARARGPSGQVGAGAGLMEAPLPRRARWEAGECLLRLRLWAGGSELTPNALASSFLLNRLDYRIHIQVHGRKIAVFILLNEDRLWHFSRGTMGSS